MAKNWTGDVILSDKKGERFWGRDVSRGETHPKDTCKKVTKHTSERIRFLGEIIIIKEEEERTDRLDESKRLEETGEGDKGKEEKFHFTIRESDQEESILLQKALSQSLP